MAKLSQSIEDYLKAVWLIRETGEPVTGLAISRRLQISQPSVSAMLKRLVGLGLVSIGEAREVALTPQGELFAREVVRHHRLLETYLAEVLGMPWDEVHAEAEVLEHHISERVEELMAAKLGNPQFDPHGHPIPSIDGTFPEHDARPLVALDAGEAGTVRQVRNEDPAVLRYLAERGIMPSTSLRVDAREPFNGPVTIVNHRGDRHALGYEIAECIDVGA